MYLRKMKRNSGRGDGFTLVEVLVAVLLVGIAIAGLMAANRALTQANGAAVDLSTAEFLAEQIRELTTPLAVRDPASGVTTFGPESDETSLAAWDDLDDFDGAVFSPPVNARRETLNNFSAYSQHITVENVNPADFSQTVADHGSPFVRVTVTVKMNGRDVTSANWLRAAY